LRGLLNAAAGLRTRRKEVQPLHRTKGAYTHMQLNQLETIEVPFRKLVASTDNVRTTPAEKEATRQLAASIQAVGLSLAEPGRPARSTR
jgi:hypothetical protein